MYAVLPAGALGSIVSVMKAVIETDAPVQSPAPGSQVTTGGVTMLTLVAKTWSTTRPVDVPAQWRRSSDPETST